MIDPYQGGFPAFPLLSVHLGVPASRFSRRLGRRIGCFNKHDPIPGESGGGVWGNEMNLPIIEVDTALVGSSPVSLFEAITLATSGHTVMVIDRASSVGGGWAVTEFAGFRDVEMGPHFIKKRDGLYEIFDWLSIPMIPMDQEPRIILPRKLFGYSRIVSHWRWFIQAAGPLLDETKPGLHLKARLRLALRYLRHRWRKSSEESLYCYPVRGCAKIIERLHGIAEDDLGIRFKLGHTVLEIQKTSEGKVRLILDDSIVIASKCILTSGSDIRKVELESGEVWTPEDEKYYSNEELLVCVDEPPLPHIEWFKFTAFEPHFILVSDVTSYAEPVTEAARGRRIIAARFNPEALEKIADVTAYTIDRLRKFGIIGAHSKIIETRRLSFPMPHRRAERAAELDEKFGDAIELMYSYDIGIPLLNFKSRWAPAMKSLPFKQALKNNRPPDRHAVH